MADIDDVTRRHRGLRRSVRHMTRFELDQHIDVAVRPKVVPQH
jgi:hypothetical protein